MYIRGTFLKQLSSLLKISVSLVSVFLFTATSRGIPYVFSAGAGEAGMGNACVMKQGFWSSFNNQALLAGNSSPSLGFNYENRFGIRELGTSTAAIILPAGKTSLGALYSRFGCTDYRRNMAGLACGLKLSENIAAGIQIDYFSCKTTGEYDDMQCFTFEAGLSVTPGKNTTIGVHLFNPLPKGLSKSFLPGSLRIGAGTELNSYLFAGAEAEISTGRKLTFRTGVEYKVIRNLQLRAGFSTNTTSFSFGTGYQAGIVTIDLGFSTHPQLGVTSSASLVFRIR